MQRKEVADGVFMADIIDYIGLSSTLYFPLWRTLPNSNPIFATCFKSESTARSAPAIQPTLSTAKVGWISLLFAVLAAGCQNSEMPRAERELPSRVLGRSLQ